MTEVVLHPSEIAALKEHYAGEDYMFHAWRLMKARAEKAATGVGVGTMVSVDWDNGRATFEDIKRHLIDEAAQKTAAERIAGIKAEIGLGKDLMPPDG